MLNDEEDTRFDELLDKYVPSWGPASPGNPETLRMISRIHYELYNNGGGNDKSKELEYINNMVKNNQIPNELHNHIQFISQFLDDKFNCYSRTEEDYDRACAYADDLCRFVMTLF